ncbi:Ribosome biogenesis ATPase rix7 [Tilletia horrida]|nr:Ribosome biogenesis ATPase rix7 [Tilletia horrida]
MNRSITQAWAAAGGASAHQQQQQHMQSTGSASPAAATGNGTAPSQHRRAKLSLNQAASRLPPGSAAAAAAAAALAQNAQLTATSESSSSTPAAASPAETPLPTAPSPVKRKARSSQRSNLTDPTSKRQRSSLQVPSSSTIAEKYTPPETRLADLGGVTAAVEKVLELIATPLCHPEIYAHTGVKPPRGILLHGPPGCGKTMLAGAIAGELGVPFLSISAPSIVSGTSGESEKTLRDTFEEAVRIAPSILFLDEIDAITPKRETAQREMERRIVAQLLTCLDDLSWEKSGGKPVMVIGATNRPDSLDPALRRAGRFDHEIAMGVPDEDGRERILHVLARKLRLSGDFDFRGLAKATPGFVGADLSALTSAAGIVAVKRIFRQLGASDIIPAAVTANVVSVSDDVEMASADNTAAESTEGAEGSALAIADSAGAEQPGPLDSVVESLEPGAPGSEPVTPGPHADEAPKTVRPLQSFFDSLPPALRTSSIALFLRTHPDPLTPAQLEPLSITLGDFLTALPNIQPSSKREGFATVPDVTWSDVGALHGIREELSLAIVQPIRRPGLFKALGVSASSGVLLWGPPGCGKTLLAKAVANESRANFISVKGPELLNKYVGESERAVRQVFARARASSPCVIFFDELDALVPKRDDAMSESSARVVNTLLTELDGLEARVQTYVIAATNRPDMIDPAMCRPGRLDKLLYVDLPTPPERLEILKTLTKKSPLRRASPNSAVHGQSESEQQQQQGTVDLQAIAMDPRAEGYSGADLAALVREAAVMALKEALGASLTASATKSFEEVTESSEVGAEGPRPYALDTEEEYDTSYFQSQDAGEAGGDDGGGKARLKMYISHSHFVDALAKVQPSVSVAQRRRYEALRSRLAGTPAGAATRPVGNGASVTGGGTEKEGGTAVEGA